MGRRSGRAVVGLVLALVGTSIGCSREVAPFVPAEQCVARVGQASVVLDPDQAHFAAIIAGESVRRGLVPRAASIALATVYQETDIRNLDYGDRDSVGLFQQRPSQGWGTPEQLLDPHYATNKFYDALVRIDGWQSADITEVAQRVQRSAYPEAYRDHEADARVLASTLTGQTRRGFSCLVTEAAAGDPRALVRSMRRTFGKTAAAIEGETLTVRAGDADRAWAYACHAVANAGRYGVVAVRIGDREWRTSDSEVPAWAAAEALRRGRVQVTLS